MFVHLDAPQQVPIGAGCSFLAHSAETATKGWRSLDSRHPYPLTASPLASELLLSSRTSGRGRLTGHCLRCRGSREMVAKGMSCVGVALAYQRPLSAHGGRTANDRQQSKTGNSPARSSWAGLDVRTYHEHMKKPQRKNRTDARSGGNDHQGGETPLRRRADNPAARADRAIFSSC